MAKYRVLIVDDQRDMRRVLGSSIEALDDDIDVIDVPSGEEAILVISRQPVDLLIADVRLPGISGLELKERSEVRNPNIRFILVTGVTDPKLRRDVANSQADAYFYKPVDVPEFLNAVLRCLGIKGGLISGDSKTYQEADTAPLPASHAEPLNLSDRLAGLRQEVGAITAVLMNDQGNIMAQAGALPDDVGAPDMSAYLATVCSAALKLSNHLGAKSQRNLFFISGMDYDIVAAHVGVSGILFVVTYASEDGIGFLAPLLEAIKSTVTDLLIILTEIGLDMEQFELPHDVPEPDIVEEEVDLNEVTEEVDTIFEKVTGKDLTTEDVDAYWENASANDHERDQVTRADVISFDQAQRLGLAPEEE